MRSIQIRVQISARLPEQILLKIRLRLHEERFSPDWSSGKMASLPYARTDHRRNICRKVEAVCSEMTVAEMAAEEIVGDEKTEKPESDVKNSQ